MNDLRQLLLEELVETALREHLIDACDHRGDLVVIVQGAMRVILSPSRAHAFLRGIIQGMSRYRVPPVYPDAFDLPGAPVPVTRTEDVPDGQQMLDSFRKHLLSKWAARYERAGSPFQRTTKGLSIWVQHNTGTTVN